MSAELKKKKLKIDPPPPPPLLPQKEKEEKKNSREKTRQHNNTLTDYRMVYGRQLCLLFLKLTVHKLLLNGSQKYLEDSLVSFCFEKYKIEEPESVCVRVCVLECVRACVRVCVRACVYVCVSVFIDISKKKWPPQKNWNRLFKKRPNRNNALYVSAD